MGEVSAEDQVFENSLSAPHLEGITSENTRASFSHSQDNPKTTSRTSGVASTATKHQVPMSKAMAWVVSVILTTPQREGFPSHTL